MNAKSGLIIFLSALIFSCSFSTKDTEAASSPPTQESKTVFSYPEQPFPQFLNQLSQNHQERLSKSYKSYFRDFCEEHKLNVADSSNQAQFFQLLLMHLLFTCNSASNAAQAGILRIPYFWHWVEPNPRHSIKHLDYFSRLKSSESDPRHLRATNLLRI